MHTAVPYAAGGDTFGFLYIALIYLENSSRVSYRTRYEVRTCITYTRT